MLADGRVLIVGGMDQHHRTLASAELYDPASRTWSFTGSMASPRRGIPPLCSPMEWCSSPEGAPTRLSPRRRSYMTPPRGLG
ncbi:MAG: hypothetical protein DME96_09575 [Verrucomicrobia bacterium]|nr:MAG: hypothetical protein DME96_09575 [Verrucomicrobiota bacterium]